MESVRSVGPAAAGLTGDLAALLKASDDRKRRASIRAAFIMGATLLIFVVALVALRAAAMGFLWAGFVVASVSYYKHSQGDGLVVWLRRFRPDYGQRLRFHRFLAAASHGLVVPVTVQDSSFSASFWAAWLRRGIPLVLFSMTFWLVGALVVAFLAVFALRSAAGLIVLILLWCPLWAWLLYRFLMRAGVTALKGQSGMATAEELLRAWGERKHAVGMGVAVVKCEDDIWRDVVARALGLARVALVDLTEPTESRWWELSTALRALGPDRVLLTVEEGIDLGVLSREAEAQMRRHGGLAVPTQWVRENVITYPARRASYGPEGAKQARDVAKSLRTALAQRLAAAQAGPSVAR